MEELVPDLEGSITANDLFDLPHDEYRFQFRMTTIVARDETKQEHDN